MKIDIRKLLFGSFLLATFTVFAATASAQMAAIAAIDEPEPAEGGGSTARAGGGRVNSGRQPRSGTQGKTPKAHTKKPKPSASARTRTSPAPPPPPPPAAYRGPILGDKYTFLNYEVESAEKPYYTRAAKASGAKGLVQVEVLVSTDGSVLSAKARTGNKELWAEAERAALASKFKRPTADGRPARAMGFLVYRFGPAED